MLLNREEVKELIEGVWTGKYNRSKLPEWLFNYTADDLEGAAVRGWQKNLGTGLLKDLELERAMQENIYYFAAHKTAHQLQDMHLVLRASTSKYQFVKRSLMINEKYNNFWYDTEYNVTMRIARAGRDWRRIEALKDLYPKLKFIAVDDLNTRATHAALNGIIRPVDDPFWIKYFPPLDWNCRCRVERLTQGTNTDLSTKQLPGVIEQFQQRVTDSRKIWHDNHPYFSGLTKMGKKAAMGLAAQKVIIEKPWEFADHYTVARELRQKYPDISFDISADKAAWDSMVKGYNLPRFVQSMVDEFAKTTDPGKNLAPSKIQIIRVKKDYDKLQIQVEGRSPFGSITLHRGYFKDATSGLKTVEHEYFAIPKQLQGGGFSKRVFQHLYKEYQSAGVQRIYVHANIDVGGYTWARYGFCMTRDKIERYIMYRIGDPAVKQRAVERMDDWFRRNPSSKLYPMNDMTEIPEMKQYLLGSNWYGEIRLVDANQKHYFEDYLYGRNK